MTWRSQRDIMTKSSSILNVLDITCSSKGDPSLPYVFYRDNASWRRNCLSKHWFFSLWGDRLFMDQVVIKTVNSVFGFWPKYASKSVTLVVYLGIRRMFSLISGHFKLRSSMFQLGPVSNKAKRRFLFVWGVQTSPAKNTPWKICNRVGHYKSRCAAKMPKGRQHCQRQ